MIDQIMILPLTRISVLPDYAHHCLYKNKCIRPQKLGQNHALAILRAGKPA